MKRGLKEKEGEREEEGEEEEEAEAVPAKVRTNNICIILSYLTQ